MSEVFLIIIMKDKKYMRKKTKLINKEAQLSHAESDSMENKTALS